MSVAKDGRTSTERKYSPIRREASRYGKIEKVLRGMQREGVTEINSQVVAYRVKILDTKQVMAILRFTKGVGKVKGKAGKFYFTGEEIRVDNE